MDVEQQTDTKEAVSRLLQAWRGEVQARALYTILAERVKDPRRADVIRAIADAEGTHRERIEPRLKELSQPIPAPPSVRLPPSHRFQPRLPPAATATSP